MAGTKVRVEVERDDPVGETEPDLPSSPDEPDGGGRPPAGDDGAPDGQPGQPVDAAGPDSPLSGLPVTGLEVVALLLLAAVLLAAGLLLRRYGRRQRQSTERSK